MCKDETIEYMKMICESCYKEFSEDELDLYNGKWLCNECEQKNGKWLCNECEQKNENFKLDN